MALHVARRAMGVKDPLSNKPYYDREALLHQVETLEAEKQALVREERRLATQLQEVERETVEVGQRLRLASRGAPLADLELIAALEQAKAASSTGCDPPRQDLEMELDLQVKQLQRSEDKVAGEAREWEARAREKVGWLARLDHKLATYPRRLVQTVETLTQEVDALRQERDALEREGQKDRAWLYESLHAAKTRLALLSTELEGLEEEMKEVEGDRAYWEAKLLQETVKSDLLMQRRKALLTKLDGTRTIEQLAYDRIMLTMQERPQVTLIDAMVEHLGPFLEPDVVVDGGSVEEALRSVVGRENGEGSLTQDNLNAVVDDLKGLRWR